ncbi:transposase [Sphingomonas carotinifaciens]
MSGDSMISASRFSDEQIIAIVKEQKAGTRAADMCRRHMYAAGRLREAYSGSAAAVRI